MTAGLHQATKARVGDVLQDPPHDLVSHTSYIETNSLVDSLSLQDDVRLGYLVRNGLFFRRPAVKLKLIEIIIIKLKTKCIYFYLAKLSELREPPPLSVGNL